VRPFLYQRVETPAAAIQAFGPVRDTAANASPVQYLAGGTTLIDLMKLDVMQPQTLIDINALDRTALGRIEADGKGLKLGALAHMAEAADHEAVKRDYPVIAQSLQLAASQQIRNMATLGGNVLQRTRCNYFRDTSYAACNKRNRGSGCAALDGFNRRHAILGVSDACIATYPGDFAQALIALDATVEVSGPKGARRFPFAGLHREPGSRPDVETTLAPGEIITAFFIANEPWLRRSLYLKIRDRQSYEFALASAAIALDLGPDRSVRQARIALGGIATVPWRAKTAEAALNGKMLDAASASAAADAAFADARAREHNTFKIALGKRTLVRGLLQTAAMEL
jgi:xanthine dehydrogenase YagS FAD-binding subunit